jgi:hypothetical protein
MPRTCLIGKLIFPERVFEKETFFTEGHFFTPLPAFAVETPETSRKNIALLT